MDLNVLESVGLTPKEAEVYEILLRLGESPVIEILNKTQDHPQIVYRALDGLEAKNLIMVSYRNHRKYVRAEDPTILKRMEEKKMEELVSVITDLKALQKTSSEALVRVRRGIEAIRDFRKNAIDVLPEGETYYVIAGTGGLFYDVMGAIMKTIERKRAKKKILKRTIMYENEREEWSKHPYPPEEARFLPEKFSSPATTVIYGNIVALQVWTADPFIIEIESREVAESYKRHFETLWAIAKS